MKLFQFLKQKVEGIIIWTRERERRIAKVRAQKEWSERMYRLMIHIQETCGPFTTEAELRGLPDAYAGPRTDGTIELMLRRASKISFHDPIIRIEEASPASKYLRSRYAIG
jgi:hypothetical protein